MLFLVYCLFDGIFHGLPYFVSVFSPSRWLFLCVFFIVAGMLIVSVLFLISYGTCFCLTSWNVTLNVTFIIIWSFNMYCFLFIPSQQFCGTVTFGTDPDPRSVPPCLWPMDSGSGSGSCYFRRWPSLRQQKTISSFSAYYFLKVHLHHFSKIKVIKKSQSSIKGFLAIFYWR